jgi:hypothetical protein
MPTIQEPVAQVENALRQRFFPLIPQVDLPARVNWTQEQHEADRLSQSPAAHTIAMGGAACVATVRLPPAIAHEAQFQFSRISRLWSFDFQRLCVR